ncbi:MAG: hypothetical protein CM1200mP10_15290 [Candidatus Neomarinimicrobiota bacterium]|nr:MAG: hypothetical protein CM1200mP10_15290 [Candidatus Neomarinimicrobiota bacterium]
MDHGSTHFSNIRFSLYSQVFYQKTQSWRVHWLWDPSSAAFSITNFGFGAALITAFYIFRLFFMFFPNEKKFSKLYDNINESPKEMTFPRVLLSPF